MLEKIHTFRVKKKCPARRNLYIFTLHRIEIPVLYKARFNYLTISVKDLRP